MKKIPAGAEACNVLVGELEFLSKPVVAFIRLSPAVLLNGLAEVPIATRSRESFTYTIYLPALCISDLDNIYITLTVVIVFNITLHLFLSSGFCSFSWGPWVEDLNIMRLEGPLRRL